ncbi:MAG: radical SAM protein [Ghiorsea sp.]
MHEIVVSGSFAKDIHNILDHVVVESSSQRLQILEKQYPWLSGLSQAHAQTQDGYELVLGKELGMLFIELTSQCNERCVHCYADSAPERSDFLSFVEIKNTLEEARKLGRAKVQFTGGDPLIHKDLLPIIDFAHKLDFESIELYTNGLLLNDALIQGLSPYHPKIAFSMYSHLPETHDLITRVKGSHKRTCVAINRAQKAGFSVRVSVIRMKENEGQEEKTLKFLQQECNLKPEQINFHLNRDIGRGEAFAPELVAVKEEEVMQPVVMEDKRVLTKHESPAQSERRGKLCVSANGDILPCVFSRHTSLGNIRQGSLISELKNLKNRSYSQPSVERWKACGAELSCGDCQMVTYMLGEER